MLSSRTRWGSVTSGRCVTSRGLFLSAQRKESPPVGPSQGLRELVRAWWRVLADKGAWAEGRLPQLRGGSTARRRAGPSLLLALISQPDPSSFLVYVGLCFEDGVMLISDVKSAHHLFSSSE